MCTTALQAMGAMNKQMNLPALSNIMREFDRQNERMEMTSEMMGDAVDDAFEVCTVCIACLHLHLAAMVAACMVTSTEMQKLTSVLIHELWSVFSN